MLDFFIFSGIVSGGLFLTHMAVGLIWMFSRLEYGSLWTEVDFYKELDKRLDVIKADARKHWFFSYGIQAAKGMRWIFFASVLGAIFSAIALG